MISRPRRASGFLRRIGEAAAVIAVLAPCAAWAASPDVTVTDGRMQVIMAARPAAGYFVLRNRGHAPLSLTGANAPDCKSLMLHKSSQQGGMARMEMVDSVRVPAGGTVRFAPGGYHLMCMDPSGPLLSGTGTEPVTLRFGDAGAIETSFAIQKAGQ